MPVKCSTIQRRVLKKAVKSIDEMLLYGTGKLYIIPWNMDRDTLHKLKYIYIDRGWDVDTVLDSGNVWIQFSVQSKI